MKINRIKDIKNIGIFRDLSASSLQFEKFSIVFWLNTFGKTTLTNIFQSLKHNDPEYITSRKSIPEITWDQKVNIVFDTENNNRDISFSRGFWSNWDIWENIEIFWTEFIYKNLFTWNQIERGNKENFTDFIIGDTWVQLVKEIENSKRRLNEDKRRIKTMIPEKYQVDEILNIDITKHDLNKVDDWILLLENIKKEKEEGLKNPEVVKNLPSLLFPSFDNNLILDLKKFNNVLSYEYANIKENFLEKFQEHISNNFEHKDIAENWIKTWFDNLKNKNWKCIFCSQSLQNAQDIIQLYDNFFDIEYKKFIQNTENELKGLQQYLQQFFFIEKEKIQLIYERALKFLKYINDNWEFKLKIETFSKLVANFNVNDLEQEFQELKNIILEKIDYKLKQPYKKVEEIDFWRIEKLFGIYIDWLWKMQEKIIDINTDIDKLKKSYDNLDVIRNEIKYIEQRILKWKDLKYRIENNEKFEMYKQHTAKIKQFEEEIKNKEENLKNNQNDYLNKYFEKINELFKKFWCRNFKLQKVESNRWLKPVYFLELLFHGEKINEDNIKNVFSESDRRALALSIFWAKIELLEQEKKNKLIVIMDDPITSFDDNRTKNFIDYLKGQYNKVSQIVVLVHYSKFLHDYYIFTENKPKTFELKSGWKIEEMNFDEFIKSDYVKKYDKIKSFIAWWDKIEYWDLRSFIEKLYTPIFINILWRDFIDTIQDKCNSYSHNIFWDPSDIENFRNFVAELFEDMYNFNT